MRSNTIMLVLGLVCLNSMVQAQNSTQTEDFRVVAGSFVHRIGAENLGRKLAEMGLTVRLEEVSVQGKPFYRVLVGPSFSTKAAAESAAAAWKLKEWWVRPVRLMGIPLLDMVPVSKAVNSAKAAAPVVTPEPAKAAAPVVTPEPAKAATPVVTPEPAKTPEPIVSPEPVKAPAPEVTPEVTPEPIVIPEPVLAPTETPVNPEPEVTPKPEVTTWFKVPVLP